MCFSAQIMLFVKQSSYVSITSACMVMQLSTDDVYVLL
jgi:hypothetical protein